MSLGTENLDYPEPEKVKSESLISTDQKATESKENLYAPFVHYVVNENRPKESKPFHSRFHGWMRAVAIAIILVFVPEQASWAFNYNPLVIWGDEYGRNEASAVAPDASQDEITSAQIANSINHLLSQIAYKEKSRVKLELPDKSSSNSDLQNHSLLIDSKTLFTKNRIRQFTDWIKNPDIHPLNCGVYSLKDITLESYYEHVHELPIPQNLLVHLLGYAQDKTYSFYILEYSYQRTLAVPLTYHGFLL